MASDAMFDQSAAQSAGTDTQGQQQQTTSVPAGTGAGSAQQSAPWLTSEKYRGKSVEDIARMHYESEQLMGRHGDELGKLRQQVEQWQNWGRTWDPHLRQFGYSPERFAQTLEQAAQAAQARGDTRTAQAAHAAAERAWADALTPQEQQQWLESFVGSQLEQRGTAQQQALQQFGQEVLGYVNRFGDMALRAIEQWDRLRSMGDKRPSLQQLLGDAVQWASGNYDPITLAAHARSAPSLDDIREQIRAEERAKLTAEQKNQGLTTFVGAGGTPSRTVLRPTSPAPGTQTPSMGRVAETRSIGDARENFLRNWNKVAAGTE